MYALATGAGSPRYTLVPRAGYKKVPGASSLGTRYKKEP